MTRTISVAGSQRICGLSAFVNFTNTTITNFESKLCNKYTFFVTYIK